MVHSKNNHYYQIIDANINRVAEGLRVIEDYTRFISKQKTQTARLAQLRKKISQSEIDLVKHLLIRDPTQDMRATDIPQKRKDTFALLKANFKRVEEGLRVLEEYTGNSLYNRTRYEIYTLEKEIILTALKPHFTSGIYLISDDESILEQGLTWKVSAIQLRDKVSSKQTILKKALRIQKKAKQAGIPFIVNDYLDIALLSNADGLHTGQDDLAIPLIRQLLGPHKLIGRSTQTLEQGIEAQNDGADYIGIGPIFSTPSKPEKQAIGLDYLKEAKKYIAILYVAIGGINLESMAQVAPCKPPLVGLIRAYKEIPEIKKKYFSKQTNAV